MIMTYTSAQAAKLLSKIRQDYDRIINQEENSKTFLASVGEDVDSVRPAYDYDGTKEQLEALESKIRKIKHAVNVFNTTTVVPEVGMTVDELLVYLPQLSRKKGKLLEMANTPPKARHRNLDKSNIVDYKYINYDLDRINADLDAVTEELSKAQLALDSVNHTAVISIDI